MSITLTYTCLLYNCSSLYMVYMETICLWLLESLFFHSEVISPNLTPMVFFQLNFKISAYAASGLKVSRLDIYGEVKKLHPILLYIFATLIIRLEIQFLMKQKLVYCA